MTLRTKYPITCSCGHKGAIKMSENDQPYSKPYESYSLENLNGNGFNVAGSVKLDQVFCKMKPTCPSCGAELTVNNFDSKK